MIRLKTDLETTNSRPRLKISKVSGGQKRQQGGREPEIYLYGCVLQSIYDCNLCNVLFPTLWLA